MPVPDLVLLSQDKALQGIFLGRDRTCAEAKKWWGAIVTERIACKHGVLRACIWLKIGKIIVHVCHCYIFTDQEDEGGLDCNIYRDWIGIYYVVRSWLPTLGFNYPAEPFLMRDGQTGSGRATSEPRCYCSYVLQGDLHSYIDWQHQTFWQHRQLKSRKSTPNYKRRMDSKQNYLNDVVDYLSRHLDLHNKALREELEFNEQNERINL